MSSQQKIPTSQQIQTNWDKLGEIYQDFQPGMMTFFLSLINLMKLQMAQNILQVGVGAGGHLPYVINQKPPTSSYYAIDISSKMIELAQEKLKKTFLLYDSLISYEQWLQKQHLFFKKDNAQYYHEVGVKFDRIICNMIVMIAENPERLLKNLHNQASNGCLIGVSVWGQKKLNTFQRFIQDAVEQIGVQAPKKRSLHHLYKNITNLLVETGWKVIVRWEQTAAIPKLQSKEVQEYFKFTIAGMKFLDEKQKELVYEIAIKKIENQFKCKRILNFPAQLVIACRKDEILQQQR